MLGDTFLKKVTESLNHLYHKWTFCFQSSFCSLLLSIIQNKWYLVRPRNFQVFLFWRRISKKSLLMIRNYNFFQNIKIHELFMALSVNFIPKTDPRWKYPCQSNYYSLLKSVLPTGIKLSKWANLFGKSNVHLYW